MNRTDHFIIVFACIVLLSIPVIGMVAMPVHANCNVHPEKQARCAAVSHDR